MPYTYLGLDGEQHPIPPETTPFKDIPVGGLFAYSNADESCMYIKGPNDTYSYTPGGSYIRYPYPSTCDLLWSLLP